ncbi:glycosyltransferase [Alkalimonas sp. MEB108]|uniref:Glycosyltransferase n=1 Tax=Alkalimonas cellulosilytica TaxID=3058395 RepID=A0ABU7J526_9GAMM|nr:glycosyltransferase [Alkalimonas sp. MEB108]MEE2001487.1 glycosyltransferase [Alkalimonas sp. MEB108]
MLDAMRALFDATWYLQANPDVAATGMDPWQHFCRFGHNEGRLPCDLKAAALEQSLWFQTRPEHEVEAELRQLLQSDAAKEQAFAAWVLARWHGSYQRWPQVLEALQSWLNNAWRQALPGHHGCWLLLVRALQQCGEQEQALERIGQAMAELGELPDLLLARASLLSDTAKLQDINRVFQQAGLTALRPVPTLQLDQLQTDVVSVVKQSGWRRYWPGRLPLVSVIIPCFNAAQTLPTALRSLQAQSWPALEILVVDDASTDHSAAVVEQFSASDSRIRLLRQADNQGAYAARNAGLAKARGRFITTHDSDDWSHPQKIELQVQALQATPKAMASISHWVRTLPGLVFERWRPEPGWIYRNTSSLLFRRQVLKKIGFWDRVSVNADTEYLERIQAAFGARAIVDVLPGVPLSFGRSDATSLTQQSVTHLRTQFVGLRQRYMAAARQWHQAATKPKELYLPKLPTLRPFAVPASMCRGTAQQQAQRQLQLLQQSDLLDPDWYLATYSDVAKAGMEPALHYLRYGGSENRDPGPNFSSSGYRLHQRIANKVNPLVHYLERLEEQGCQQDYGSVQLAGERNIWPERPWLLVVAHAAGPDLYGAERSLLDVLKALQALGLNLLLTLPGVRSEAYLAQVQAEVQQLAVLPYRWWYQGRQECEQTIERFKNLMQQYKPVLCYCNTLVLSEPLHAARQLLIPGMVHVRELPGADEALCLELGADASQIRNHLLALADGFIANSQASADYLAAPERTVVIANVVDVERFAQIPQRAGDLPLRLGMISSNLPKKGLQDFIRLSQLLAARQLPVECWLIGPDNDHTAQLKAEQAAGHVPALLHFAGYAATPEAALAPLDMVVNLSHFQESFGRTVLEAMAAGRVVVCYRWGALPELVQHEHTGLLADFADIEAVASAIARLVADNQLRQRLIANAFQQVVSAYSPAALQQQLANWLVAQGIIQQEAL